MHHIENSRTKREEEKKRKGSHIFALICCGVIWTNKVGRLSTQTSMFCSVLGCWQQVPCLYHQSCSVSSVHNFPWGDPLLEDDADEERERYNKIKQREAERHRPWRSSAEDFFTGPRCLKLEHSVIQYQVSPFTPSSAYTFTGRRIWDSALVLVKYMQLQATANPQWLAGKKVLELGAGLALPTLVACAFGASVAVCTDVPHQIALIEKNIALNGFTQAKAMPLTWGVIDSSTLNDLGKPFDLVLFSDLLFSSEGTTSLVDTLCSVCSENTLVLASNEHRWVGASDFYDLLRTRGFQVDHVDNQSLDAVFRGPDFYVIQARRVSQADGASKSLLETWIAPPTQ